MMNRHFHFLFPIIILPFRSIKFNLVFIFIGLAIGNSYGQSINALERQQQRLEERINLTKDLLQASESEHQDALLTFQTLDQQIESRNELMTIYQQFIQLSDSSQERSKSVISAMQDDLADLQKEYGQIMQIALRQKLTDSKVLFLLSADNFSDVFRRWQFIKRYNETRHRQIENIQQTQRVLYKKMALLEKQKLEKLQFIEDEKIEAQNLKRALADRDKILAELSKSAKDLEKKLNEQENARLEMSRQLEALMQKQLLAAAREKERKKTTTKAPVENTETGKKSTARARAFSSEKGKLPWPVKEGVVIKKFGQQAHPTLKGIFIQNNGIDIACRSNASVAAVHHGKVAQIQQIAGYQSIVVLQHGAYYSVYSNLAYVDVLQDQTIEKGQIIGQLGEQNQGPLHFEIWYKKSKKNPQRWIKRK